jgi:hypothetical protein
MLAVLSIYYLNELHNITHDLNIMTLSFLITQVMVPKLKTDCILPSCNQKSLLTVVMPLRNHFRKYRVYHLKHNATTNTYHNTKNKSEACPPLCNVLFQPPHNTKARSPLVLGCCSCQLYKSYASAIIMHSKAENVFIFEYYISSKLCAAVCEAFTNVYPDKDAPNETTIH